MKYISRSLKYFISMAVVFSLVVTFVYFTSEKSPNVNSVLDLFQDGAWYKIILFLIAISAVYPTFGYYKKKIFVNDNFLQKKDEVISFMNASNYTLVQDSDNVLIFRLSNKFLRFMRLYEDFIVIEYGDNPVIIEGLRKDVIRYGRGIERIMQTEA